MGANIAHSKTSADRGHKMSNQLRRLFYCVAALAVTPVGGDRDVVFLKHPPCSLTIRTTKEHERVALADPFHPTAADDEGDASTSGDAPGDAKIRRKRQHEWV